MRVLMLSWEYPPLVIGGLARHVESLSRHLIRDGHEVCVLTRGQAQAAADEVRDGVRVWRAALDPIAVDFSTESLIAWSQVLEHALTRRGLSVLEVWQPDVVHAHDWLVAQTGKTLSQQSGAPLIATVHATESGRHRGRLPAALNVAIDSLERWLVHSASAVITCSSAMKQEVAGQFGLDLDAVQLVPNGIDTDQWRVGPAARRDARDRYAPSGPLLVFAGRLVHEKGLQTLLDALPAVRRAHPEVRLLVAGSGPYEAELRDRARARRVARSVHWLGFLTDSELAPVLAAADAVVVPSTYEPFGLVALEAAACGVPVVVSETGGLADLVRSGAAAASFPPGDRAALAEALCEVLDDPSRARLAVRRASRLIQRDYSWASVAARTAQTYAAAAPGTGRRQRPAAGGAARLVPQRPSKSSAADR